MRELRIIGLQSGHEVQAGDDLIEWVLQMCKAAGTEPAAGDILVFAQKVVSKSEGRRVALASVTPSDAALELARKTVKDPRLVELILRESSAVVRATDKALIVRHKTGVVLANAGIDRSNVKQDDAGETVLLWPTSPDASAERLHRDLFARLGLRIPVLINDSLGRAWRKGTIGTAIGAAGFNCLLDLRGKSDRHGFTLVSTEVAAADELAAAASIVMGQSDESIPAVLIRGAGITGQQGKAAQLLRPAHEDLFP